MTTREERIARANDLIKVGTETLKAEGVGDAAGQVDLGAKHRAEDEASTLFERSSPAERTQLLQKDPEAWQRMMDAYEQKGLRRLFGR